MASDCAPDGGKQLDEAPDAVVQPFVFVCIRVFLRKRNQIHAFYNPVPFHEHQCSLVPETEESHGAGCGQTRKAWVVQEHVIGK